MKLIYTALFAALLVLPACNRNDGDRVHAASPEGTANTDQMKQQRDDYVKSINAKLDEFDQKFDGLDERASAMKGEAKDNFQKDIDQLRDDRKAVARKLDDLKGVSLDSWMTLKGEVDSAMASLEQSYQRVSAGHETVPAAAPTPHNSTR